jgi:hypothetical protein
LQAHLAIQLHLWRFLQYRLQEDPAQLAAPLLLQLPALLLPQWYYQSL